MPNAPIPSVYISCSSSFAHGTALLLAGRTCICIPTFIPPHHHRTAPPPPVFGLLEAKTAGKPIPGDVAYDESGNATTDPAEALKGAIRVFDRCVLLKQEIPLNIGGSSRLGVFLFSPSRPIFLRIGAAMLLGRGARSRCKGRCFFFFFFVRAPTGLSPRETRCRAPLLAVSAELRKLSPPHPRPRPSCFFTQLSWRLAYLPIRFPCLPRLRSTSVP